MANRWDELVWCDGRVRALADAAIAPDDMERPDGARTWAGRARWLQHQLIHRWSTLYSA